jgi:hypothetical protein
MVVLSVLIISALVTAVASIFIVGAQWLLLITAALIIAAFGFSRRSSRQVIRDAEQAQPNPADNRMTAAQRRGVIVDHRDLMDLTGRHRDKNLDTANRDAKAQDNLTRDNYSSAPGATPAPSPATERIELAERG